MISNGQKQLSDTIKSIYTSDKYTVIDNCRQVGWLISPDKGKRLEIDVAVFDQKGNIILAAEYHGKHHYQPSKLFHRIEGEFERGQMLDAHKRELLIKKNIPFLEFNKNNIKQAKAIILNIDRRKTMSNEVNNMLEEARFIRNVKNGKFESKSDLIEGMADHNIQDSEVAARALKLFNDIKEQISNNDEVSSGNINGTKKTGRKGKTIKKVVEYLNKLPIKGKGKIQGYDKQTNFKDDVKSLGADYNHMGRLVMRLCNGRTADSECGRVLLPYRLDEDVRRLHIFPMIKDSTSSPRARISYNLDKYDNSNELLRQLSKGKVNITQDFQALKPEGY